ncbi:MAG: serine/threonine-protein kinase [Isosphaeraceae bacterium]
MSVIGIGTTLNDRFLLQEELGRGGMGSVYAATDQVLQRGVAIKVLKDRSGEEVGRKLRLEAQIAARLLHENVVRIYDFGQAGATWFLVMEQVDGPSYVKRWRVLTLAERLRVLAAVADALDYAHHQGVIHRDIKPGNVLLTAQGVPKLSDFGLSLLAEQADEAGTIRGTPHYMSPEQAKGKRLDYRTDLYSLGVMLYESATGSVPFTGPPLSVIAQHYTCEPEPPRRRNPGISEELERLILACMARRPEDRPASGAALAQALREEVARIEARQAEHGHHAAAAEVPAGPDLAALADLEHQAAEPEVPPAAATGRAGAERPGPPAEPIAPPATAADLVASPLVRKMLRTVLEEPVILSADERYLMGHYLAFLLIGSRRKGFFMRRPQERRNADRARYLLAMTYALASGPTEEAVHEAAGLLDQRIEVRPALSPVVVAKFLSWRDTPQRRRLFRQTRQALRDASTYARESLTDAKGLLNPGLVPQTLDDLRKIAPARKLVDDVLVERWNQLAEIWRDHPEFRSAALRYAAAGAHRDPASQALWPEVVYPLIELARWQRRSRGRIEAIWDAIVGTLFRAGDAGVELDRLLRRTVPAQVVAQIDASAGLLDRRPPEDDEDDAEPAPDEADRLGVAISGSSLDLDDLAADAAPAGRELIPLADPDPTRFLQGELNELWKEAVNALAAQARGAPGGARPGGHRHIPLGPYRVVVVASIRGKAAGQIAIQGMSNKQVELTTPSFRTTGSANKPILAVWRYRNNSLVISHLDFQGNTRYVLWNAPRGQHLKYDDPSDLLDEVDKLGMEPPDQLEEALTRRFRPNNKI